MEVLQTIWNALTTENELIMNIIDIPLVFIEMYVSMQLFTTILNIQTSKRQQFIYVITLGVIGLITAWTVPVPYNTFINIIACPILVYFIFKTNILKSILAEVIPYITSVILISFLPNVYTIIFNTDSSKILTIPIHKFCYSIIQYSFIYILYILCKHFEFNINIKHNLRSKNNLLLLINFIVGIIALAIQSYITTKYTDILPYSVQSSSMFILLTYFTISILSLSRTSKLEDTAENLEKEKLYNKTLTTLYDNIRDFRHNFNNIIQSFGGYISNNNMEGIKTYYNEVLNASQISNNLAVLNPELINNPAVYSILSSKYYTAEEFGIKMNLEILLDLKNLNIKTYDLTLILGILLDNAIDAAKESDEKQINVIIRKDNKASRDLFIIENSYANKDVDMDRIFEKGYTSKEDEDNQSHGLGLWNVRKILKKNNNLNLFTSKDSKLFKQQLEIYS